MREQYTPPTTPDENYETQILTDSGSNSTPSVINYQVQDLTTLKKDEVLRLISQGGVNIQVTEAKEIRLLIASAFGIPPSHIKSSKRNKTRAVLRATTIYAYILQDKLRMSRKEIKSHYGNEVSDSTISRWISSGKGEIESNPTAQKLFDSIEAISL